MQVVDVGNRAFTGTSHQFILEFDPEEIQSAAANGRQDANQLGRIGRKEFKFHLRSKGEVGGCKKIHPDFTDVDGDTINPRSAMPNDNRHGSPVTR